MGWWSDYKPRGMSMKEWANKKYTFNNDDIQHTVLDAALVNRSVLYVACDRLIKETGLRYTYCLIVLIRWENGHNWNMMIKEMDESCGPNEAQCPERIFKLLSPIRKLGVTGSSFTWTKNWRNRVKGYHDALKAWRSVNNGMTIKTERAFHFGGNQVDTFKVYDKRKGHYIPLQDCQYNLVKLSKPLVLSTGYTTIGRI